MVRVKSVRALERGLQVLEHVRAIEAISLDDLHRRTRLPRATLLRALKTLEQNGWVQRARHSGAYRLGPKLSNTIMLSERQRSLADLAGPVLDELGKKAMWPSDVGICRSNAMLILESSRRNSPFVINRNVVGRRPNLLRSAMGRAYLAFCPADERERLLERLRRSTNPDDRIAGAALAVGRILQETRARGYGVREAGYWAGADDFGGELSSIAVPVMIGDNVIACISLLWIAGTITVEDFAATHLRPLHEAAALLARGVEEQRRTRHDAR